MNQLRVWTARIAGLFRKSTSEQELDEELAFHFEKEVELLVSRGLSLADAKAEARKHFGAIDRAKEVYRDTRGVPIVENFLRDLQYAFRMARRNPGFVAIAAGCLGLGIGANSAVFTVVNAALLRELPVPEPDRLARIAVSMNGRPREFSYPAFLDLSQRQQSFSGLTASGGLNIEHAILDGRELQELGRMTGLWVSSNYFQLMGMEAAVGRVFSPSDAPPQDSVAVLRYDFWQSALGGDVSVIGKTLSINGVPLTIVGIAPRGFTGDQVGRIQDVWVPITLQPRFSGQNFLESHTTFFFRTLGRLKPDVSETAAAAEITGIYRQFLQAEARVGAGSRINRPSPVSARAEVLTGMDGFNPARTRLMKPLAILMGVVVLVLLIACGNVAGLLIARGSVRRQEIATRMALGSSRVRLLAQHLTESLLLALLGCSIGLFLARLGTRFLAFVSEDIFYATLDLEPDARVLAFTVLLSLLATMVFGIVPAWSATKEESHPLRIALSRFRARAGRSLVVGQVALSLFLLMCAGLLARSVWNLRQAELGLDRGHVSTFQLTRERGLQPSEAASIHDELNRRLSSIPGVRSVAFSNCGLFAMCGMTASLHVPSSTVSTDAEPNIGYVSPRFFETLGLKLASGRTFKDREAAASAMISEALAQRYFADKSPLGQSIYMPGIDERGRYIPFSEGLAKARRFEVVGVLRDAFDRGPREAPALRVYLPVTDQFADTLYVRTAGDPAAITLIVLNLMKEFSGKVRIAEFMTLEEQLNQNYSFEILGSRLLSVFGFLALLLSGVGLYGLMSYAVDARRSEIGIRMAMGAAAPQVLRMILREAATLVFVGILVGLPLALGAARFLRSMLFGLAPDDYMTIAAAVAILFTAGMIAAFIPAWRASRVDPMTTLRVDAN